MQNRNYSDGLTCGDKGVKQSAEGREKELSSCQGFCGKASQTWRHLNRALVRKWDVGKLITDREKGRVKQTSQHKQQHRSMKSCLALRGWKAGEEP